MPMLLAASILLTPSIVPFFNSTYKPIFHTPTGKVPGYAGGAW